jgi:ubiquitin-protein ligase E3 C
VWQVLKHIPFVIPFETRVKVFQHFNDVDKDRLDENFIPPVNVRREYIFEDGFSHLHALGPLLKKNIRVQFINNQGLLEAGIGQGVFKEFLIELSKTAFSANYGLFKFTHNHKIYPNPSSELVAGEDHLSRFEFLGKILGKAIYEKILVDIPFARFFISKILGSNNFVNDLPSLDPELHKNLMFLRYYEGDAEDLALNFTIMDDEFGSSIERELVPNGKNIAVNNKNKLQYIYRVAHYRLNTQINYQVCDVIIMTNNI